ncbi:unnamed protein product [Musa textilis]
MSSYVEEIFVPPFFSYTCKNPFIFYQHIANIFSEYNKHDSNNNFECAHTPTGALEIHDCLIVARRDADAFGMARLPLFRHVYIPFGMAGIDSVICLAPYILVNLTI